MSDTQIVTALTDGQRNLADGNFAEAARLFDQALAQNAADATAHEGALLAHYQCRTLEELAALGVCFEQNADYLAARDGADAAALTRYDTAQADALWYAHVHVIRALRQPHAARRLALRAQGYDAFPAHDEELSAIHSVLVKNAGTPDKSDDYCAALMELLDRYDAEPCRGLPQVETLTDCVREEYKATTDAILQKLEDSLCPPPSPETFAKKAPVSTNDLLISRQWEREKAAREQKYAKPTERDASSQPADPLALAAAWAEPVAGRQTHLGADGGPDTVAARYLYLAEKLTPAEFFNKEKPVNLSVAIDLLFGCCDRAENAGAHPSHCHERRQALVNALLTPKLPAVEREHLCAVCHDDARPCLAVLRDRLTPCTARNPSEHLVLAVLKGGDKVYARYANDLTALDQWIEQQRDVVAAYDGHAEKLKAEAEPLIRNLVADAAAEARMTFENDLQALSKQELSDATAAHNQLEKLENLRPSFEAHFAKREKRRYRLAIVGAVVRPLISLLCVLAAGGAALIAWLNLQHPERIAAYPVLWYSLIAVAVCIVGGVILALIVGRQKVALDKKYHTHRLPKIIINFIFVLLFAAIIAAIVMFVMYGLRYGKADAEPAAESSAVVAVEEE